MEFAAVPVLVGTQQVANREGKATERLPAVGVDLVSKTQWAIAD